MGRIKHSAALFTSHTTLTEKSDDGINVEFIDTPDPNLELIRKNVIDSLVGLDIRDSFVTPIVLSSHNGYCSFAILPDGSKEGWDASDQIDTIRENAIRHARSMGIDCVFVMFGGDDDFTEIR